MKKIIFLVLLSFLRCSTDKNPMEPVPTENYLLGTWVTQHSEVSFNVDKTFTKQFFGPTYGDEEDSKISSVFAGNYEVDENIISLNNLSVTYIDESIDGVSYIVSKFEYKIVQDTLHLTSINIFDREKGSGDSLWGRWSEVRWGCHYKNNPLEKDYSGLEEYYYEFWEDSSLVNYGWDHLEENPWEPFHSTAEYQYSPPYLYIQGEPLDILVSFSDNKMKWVRNTIKYTRARKN